VRIWDPATGHEQLTLEGHTDWVYAVCQVEVGSRALLASASDDRTVRIWDPATGVCRQVIPVHHQALALVWARELLIVGLSDGLIALSLSRS
jgi:WD40 repeat protein